MIEPVEKKIQEINLKKKKALRKQKDQNLLRWGFDGKRKNKNDIPLILTDEEYNAILEAEKSYSGAVKSDKNPLANLLLVMAVAAVVIGIVAGIVLYQIATDIGFIYFTASVIVGVFTGVILYALSEILKMLQQLVDRD